VVVVVDVSFMEGVGEIPVQERVDDQKLDFGRE
jgi:hypothetical protein